MTEFDEVAAALRACRLCRDAPRHGGPLPVEPRPIVQGSATARLCIASQAPGHRAFRSGRPFQDPSGRRLRAWLGLDEATFYDPARIAILPMGACFPGHDAAGGDLPPRRECAETWRARLLAGLPALDLVLVIGQYAQAWHLGRAPGGLTGTVARWRELFAEPRRPRVLPLPHPSWRNSGWLKRHPWFEAELLPVLRREVARLTG
ncbi:uracil-DNA glycosylase superfamily [Methylobacterium sp. 4-46]|uniref:uracil-DNA glycosylase family protein n=1 Tax=unclassified Methylobacterium TaxID=2615210 RepID=UPI000152C749|nr:MULTISPECIES: uracil-DNA glycosylase family protein [Methylobacterium]ACA17016.1 uracil-DNA glycosylase superfamily [Methylobacterium sp. 4-46]WFT82705.1 uracil-DNA glycosylase family protein [Methylobacterium nodulans]